MPGSVRYPAGIREAIAKFSEADGAFGHKWFSAETADQLLDDAREAAADIDRNIDRFERMAPSEQARYSNKIFSLFQKIAIRFISGTPDGQLHEPQVVAHKQWEAANWRKYSDEFCSIANGIPNDGYRRLEAIVERLLAFKKQRVDSLAYVEVAAQKAAQASERYDSHDGLAKLEASLGVAAGGNEAERIDAIVVEVARKVAEWEGMTPSALLRDHAQLSALFTVTEKAHVSSYVNDGYLRDCWWARLVLRLSSTHLFDDLTTQIHRETQALTAQSFLKDERSMGGKRKAAGSPQQAAKTTARDLWPEANRKGWTATQFHAAITGKGHAIPFDTARKWLTALRKTGTC